MCGFVSIINKNKTRVDRELLASMASLINHRGPDDEGEYIDDTLGLYHKRLSIIDLEKGHQPMTCGACTIVYNGEIYNYKTLC